MSSSNILNEGSPERSNTNKEILGLPLNPETEADSPTESDQGRDTPNQPTKTVQYESQIVVEEEGRRATQNIQISRTYTPNSSSHPGGDDNRNMVMEWISSENDTLTDFDTTTFLHLNLLTELARSKCICRKRQNEVAKEEAAGPSEDKEENTKQNKKARYSWQVKNLHERTQENQAKCELEDHSGEGDCVQKSGDEKMGTESENSNNVERKPTRKRNVSPDLSSEDLCSPKSKYPNIAHLEDSSFANTPKDDGLSESNSSGNDGPKDSKLSTSSTVPEDSPKPGTSVQILDPATSETSVGDTSKTSKDQGPSENQNQDGERSSSPPFHVLQIREIASRNYLQNLQDQHIAKSIVDNALNTTLEVLGFSPDNSRRNIVNQRRRVEDDAVSAAIQSRGLQNQESASIISDPTSPASRSERPDADIDPIINQLTEFSENIFARNLQQSKMARAVTTGSDSGSSDDEEARAAEILESSMVLLGEMSTKGASSQITQETHAEPSTSESKLTKDKTTVQEFPSSQDLDKQPSCTEISVTPSSKKTHESGGRSSEFHQENVCHFGDLLEDSSALQSDILDKAVAAAINQKGLGIEQVE